MKCYVLALIAITCACAWHAVLSEGISQDSITYEDASSGAEVVISGNRMTIGVRAGSKSSNEHQTIVDQVQSQMAIVDCSTNTLMCKRADTFVFAVPRGRLNIGRSYSVAGSRLKLEACLAKTGNVCTSVLVRSDCERYSSTGCSVVKGGRGASSNPGPLTFFVYDKSSGITSLGLAMTVPKDTSSMARTMLLKGKKGLLCNGCGT